MTLEQAYFVSGIVAAMAVIGSLLYLAIQVRQNTKSVKMSTGQAITEDLRTLFRYSAENDAADVVYRGFKGIETLEGSDRLRFYAMMHDYFFAFQNAYFQMQAGALDQRYWSSALNAFRHIGSFPGVRTYWQERNFYYWESYRELLNREVFADGADRKYHLAGEHFDRPEPISPG